MSPKNATPCNTQNAGRMPCTDPFWFELELQDERDPQDSNSTWPPSKTWWRSILRHAACTQSVSERLDLEIVALVQWLRPTEHEHHIRFFVQREAVQLLETLDAKASVELFGSCRVGIGLPTSDMDLNVSSDAIKDVPTLARWLKGATLNRNHTNHSSASMMHPFYNYHVIPSARVPLVKCTHRVTCIDVDFTLNNMSGRFTTLAARSFVDTYPEARALVLVLKVFLRQRGLMCVRSGGLGSYSLLLLTIRYLQQRPIHTKQKRESPSQLQEECPGEVPLSSGCGYGRLLLGFLKLYGIDFNAKAVAVDVARNCFRKRNPPEPSPLINRKSGVGTDGNTQVEDSTAVPEWEGTDNPSEELVVFDPTNPKNNVAAATKNFTYIQQAFRYAYYNLHAVHAWNKDSRPVSSVENEKDEPPQAVLTCDSLLSRIILEDTHMRSIRKHYRSVATPYSLPVDRSVSPARTRLHPSQQILLHRSKPMCEQPSTRPLSIHRTKRTRNHDALEDSEWEPREKQGSHSVSINHRSAESSVASSENTDARRDDSLMSYSDLMLLDSCSSPITAQLAPESTFSPFWSQHDTALFEVWRQDVARMYVSPMLVPAGSDHTWTVVHSKSGHSSPVSGRYNVPEDIAHGELSSEECSETKSTRTCSSSVPRDRLNHSSCKIKNKSVRCEEMTPVMYSPGSNSGRTPPLFLQSPTLTFSAALAHSEQSNDSSKKKRNRTKMEESGRFQNPTPLGSDHPV